MAACTGGEKEVTHFTLPPGAAAVLRLIAGYETFDEHQEVLLALKAATGTKGAPRAFSLKLSRIMRSPPLNLKPISRDQELEVSHDDSRELTMMRGKRVGDIKVAG